jgi:hypothetical protein
LLFAVFGGVYAIAKTVQSRTEVVRPLARRRTSSNVLAAALVLAAAVIALRFTVTRDWFGAEARELWEIPGPATWLHATVVAALIIWLVLRSQSTPRTRGGWGVVTALLVTGAMSPFLQWTVIFFRALVGASLGQEVSLGIVIREKGPLELIPLVGILIVALVQFRRRSVGAAMAYVALAFLGVHLADRWVQSSIEHPRLWAEATQVVVVIVGACVVLFAIDLVSRRELIPRSAILLLAVVPLIAVHGSLLLPIALSSVVGRARVVVGILGAALLAAPRIAADPLRRSWQSVRFTAFNLLLIASYTLAIGIFAPYEDPFQGQAVTWLALPIATALCVRVADRSEPEAPELLGVPLPLLGDLHPQRQEDLLADERLD